MPNDNLFDFAWFPVPPPHAFEERLRSLKALAQHEEWEIDSTKPVGILNNYLRYTFKRLVQEGKVCFGPDSRGIEVASFNVGLFTPSYEPIFAFFERNTNPDRQPWVFKDFVREGDRRLGAFPVRPKPARYFDRPEELIYDPDRELLPNLDHMLDDNAERFPPGLRDNRHLLRLALSGAIADAGKRAQMNYKVAVPQFYFGHQGAEPGRIQLLLPLCFESPRQTDLALVVQREGAQYAAATVLTLDMAYTNARLIARPETDWLPRPTT